MFADLPPAPPVGPTLWDSSLESRIRHLLAGKRRVVWIYRAPDTSTFRYRVANEIAAFESGDPDCRGTWFDATELGAVTRVLEFLDAIVLSRYPYSPALARLIEQADGSGVRLLFDCDDLVFDPAFVPSNLEALGLSPDDGVEWDSRFAYAARLNATMRRCEAGITTNDVLAARMAPYFPDGSVRIVPNVLERSQEEFSRELLKAKAGSGWQHSGPVTVGYFSGTPSHREDFAMATPALTRLMDANPDVELRIAGYMDSVENALERHSDRVRFLPFMHFIDLQRAVADVDINIAPLRHNLFNNCKSDLKYFEAAVVGTWTVASRTPPFAQSIQDGVSGRLAREHEWDDALADAVDLARDPLRYGQLSEKAADEAYQSHGWDSIGDAVREAVLT